MEVPPVNDQARGELIRPPRWEVGELVPQALSKFDNDGIDVARLTRLAQEYPIPGPGLLGFDCNAFGLLTIIGGRRAQELKVAPMSHGA